MFATFKSLSIPMSFQLNQESIQAIFDRYGVLEPVIIDRRSRSNSDYVCIGYNTNLQLSKTEIQTLEKEISHESGASIEAVDINTIPDAYQDSVLALSRNIYSS